MTIQNEGLHLPYFRLVLGVAALLVSLYFTVLFLSQGVKGAEFIAIVVFAIIADSAKIMFAGDVTFYRAIKKHDSAFASFLIVVVLMALSMFAGFWYLASNPLKGKVAFHNNEQRIEELKSEVNSKEAALARCEPTHVKKCITPRTAELTALQNQLSEEMKLQDNFTDSVANEQFWKNTAASLGASATNLKNGFDMLRSVLLELLGVVLCGQFFGNSRLKHYKPVYDVESHEKPLSPALPEKPVEHPQAENVVKLPVTRLEKTEEEQPEKKYQ